MLAKAGVKGAAAPRKGGGVSPLTLFLSGGWVGEKQRIKWPWKLEALSGQTAWQRLY
jgi:hypothetical protein